MARFVILHKNQEEYPIAAAASSKPNGTGKNQIGILKMEQLRKSMGAVALRKMIQDIAGINHSSIRYPVYILLNATAPFLKNHLYIFVTMEYMDIYLYKIFQPKYNKPI